MVAGPIRQLLDDLAALLMSVGVDELDHFVDLSVEYSYYARHHTVNRSDLLRGGDQSLAVEDERGGSPAEPVENEQCGTEQDRGILPFVRQ